MNQSPELSYSVPLFPRQRPIRKQVLFHKGKSQQSWVDDLEGPCHRLQWPSESLNCVQSPKCGGQDKDTAHLISSHHRKHLCPHPLLHFPTLLCPQLSSSPRQPSRYSLMIRVWASHPSGPSPYVSLWSISAQSDSSPQLPEASFYKVLLRPFLQDYSTALESGAIFYSLH